MIKEQLYEVYIEKTICYQTWVRAASQEAAQAKTSIIEDRTSFSDYDLRGTGNIFVIPVDAHTATEIPEDLIEKVDLDMDEEENQNA